MQGSITGLLSQSGRKWIAITSDDRKLLVPFAEFHGAAKAAVDRLGAAGLILPGSKRVQALLEQVMRVRDFVPADVVEKVGWNGPHFALPDGTVFSPPEVRTPLLAFNPVTGRCSVRGDFRKWRRKVARKLTGQSLAEFAMCLAFAPPLLALTNRVGNFGFELVGVKGTGKSRIQQLVSSALGGATQGEDGHYWVSFDATPNALEQMMQGFSDLLLVLEEANLFLAGETPRVRGNAFKALAFRMGNGSTKARFDQAIQRETRLLIFSSSNEPLAELIGLSSEAARAAEDRLITIPLLASRAHGVFDFIPEKHPNGDSFIAELISNADEHHGHAIRRFLTSLVADRARDEVALRAKIADLIVEFRMRAGANLANGSAIRVADAFGLVYAAGVLAKEYTVLPGEYRPGASVSACYQMHLAKQEASTSFREQLLAIAARDDVIDLGAGKLPEITEDQRNSAAAFIRSRGERELWILPENIVNLVPNWASIGLRQDVLAFLKREGSQRKVKRPIGPRRKPVRVYCFLLGR